MGKWIRWYIHMALLNVIAHGCGVSDKASSIYAIFLAIIFFIGCFLDRDDEKDEEEK